MKGFLQFVGSIFLSILIGKIFGSLIIGIILFMGLISFIISLENKVVTEKSETNLQMNNISNSEYFKVNRNRSNPFQPYALETNITNCDDKIQLSAEISSVIHHKE